MVVPALIAIAISPAAAQAEIAVTTSCAPKQRQAGHVIRMSIVVEAAEGVIVDGHGTVRVRGQKLPLVRRFDQPLTIAPGAGYNFKLVPPTPKVAAKIARALNDGRELRARGTLEITSATEFETPRFRTRFTR